MRNTIVFSHSELLKRWVNDSLLYNRQMQESRYWLELLLQGKNRYVQRFDNLMDIVCPL